MSVNDHVEPSGMDRLGAERDVSRTFLRYFELLDARRHDDVAGECLAPGAVIEDRVPGPRRLRGRDELTAHLVNDVAPWSQMVAHVIGQTVVEWDGGRPRAMAYVTAWYWYRQNTRSGDLRPADWTAVWFVEDGFSRFDDRWLIARRTMTPVGGLVAAGAVPGGYGP